MITDTILQTVQFVNGKLVLLHLIPESKSRLAVINKLLVEPLVKPRR